MSPLKLTRREMHLFIAAINWCIRYTNSNPDIGMGPSKVSLTYRVAESLSFAVCEKDIIEAAAQADA